MLGISLGFRLILKLFIYMVHLHTLQNYAQNCLPVEEPTFGIQANDIANRLKIRKPIRLKKVPNVDQVNIVVWETREHINIFFLKTVPGKGAQGALAHELAHVALGHTKQNSFRADIFILFCFVGYVLAGSYSGVALQSFPAPIHLIPLLVFLWFGLYDLPRSRGRELKADRLATRTVGKEEVIAFLNLFSKEGQVNNLSSHFWGSHPPTGKRIKAVEAMRDTLGRKI